MLSGARFTPDLGCNSNTQISTNLKEKNSVSKYPILSLRLAVELNLVQENQFMSKLVSSGLRSGHTRKCPLQSSLCKKLSVVSTYDYLHHQKANGLVHIQRSPCLFVTLANYFAVIDNDIMNIH